MLERMPDRHPAPRLAPLAKRRDGPSAAVRGRAAGATAGQVAASIPARPSRPAAGGADPAPLQRGRRRRPDRRRRSRRCTAWSSWSRPRKRAAGRGRSAEWLMAERGRAHLALARRGSRVALYDAGDAGRARPAAAPATSSRPRRSDRATRRASRRSRRRAGALPRARTRRNSTGATGCSRRPRHRRIANASRGATPPMRRLAASDPESRTLCCAPDASSVRLREPGVGHRRLPALDATPRRRRRVDRQVADRRLRRGLDVGLAGVGAAPGRDRRSPGGLP